MDSNELVNKRVHVIAQAHGCAIDDVHAVLDRHPIELDRDAYLRRTLALELLRLDQLEMAFEGKALRDGDVAAGVLMVKIAERRATLLGLNAPLGHSVHVVHNPAPHQPTATDKIEAALKALIVISLQSREIRQCLQCCASRRHATFFGQCRAANRGASIARRDDSAARLGEPVPHSETEISGVGRGPLRLANTALRTREYLTPAEVERLIHAARGGRHGHRDSTLILVAYLFVREHGGKALIRSGRRAKSSVVAGPSTRRGGVSSRG